MKTENYNEKTNDEKLIEIGLGNAYDMYEFLDNIKPSMEAVKQFIMEYKQSGRYSSLCEYLIRIAIKKLDVKGTEDILNDD